MSDIAIRIDGRAGRITLNRPRALNALTYEMCLAIDAALRAWAEDPEVALVLIEGAGEKAFSAGGDIVEMYETGTRGDYSYGRRFWRDEYRMNARIAGYPKPVVSFLQGFTMGGGVGVGCHGSHRIVGETSQIAMPECGIGLIPDVGGTYLLARAPGRLGEYYGMTGARMGPGDAVLTGFASHYLPQADWDAAKATLVETGTVAELEAACPAPPEARIAPFRAEIDTDFNYVFGVEVEAALDTRDTEFSRNALLGLRRGAPLSTASALHLIRMARGYADLREALRHEYRWTWRAAEHGDFIEGIRAQVIDKDRTPRWQHAKLGNVTPEDVRAMVATLGPDELTFEGETP
ncbi:enoyl-CoA hydratase/isomerase family protein [Dinoroseobacter sp. PD6]|uniref:enoyl-CoA hydratase/isomerase family protein n=1 Tax=Dinoroseobacter sp. PD6 TaxID=3028384 RepID=UPI00237AE746|nr:enoyl-CoA hydratase/isomerase family protein [Dinoroseobacter sp. PD6]MDD9715410.1 enoyl-CoA hydratase/isomerase family protein [Dinoroseobacter sp. PD6]